MSSVLPMLPLYFLSLVAIHLSNKFPSFISVLAYNVCVLTCHRALLLFDKNTFSCLILRLICICINLHTTFMFLTQATLYQAIFLLYIIIIFPDLTIASDRLHELKAVEFHKDDPVAQQISVMTANVELCKS